MRRDIRVTNRCLARSAICGRRRSHGRIMVLRWHAAAGVCQPGAYTASCFRRYISLPGDLPQGSTGILGEYLC